MTAKRVAGFVDGFNLYHALLGLGKDHSCYKWLNLWRLCSLFAPSPDFQLVNVFYFSAYATWRPDSYRRHQAYVAALNHVGVTTILGNFKPKTSICPKCQREVVHHEEKETDVNIALHLLLGAFEDSYDRALLISRDSDLAPAVRMVVKEFPDKQVRVIAPIGIGGSADLLAAVGKDNFRHMRIGHLNQSLFPRQICDSSGNIVVTRPAEYDPPT